MKVEKAQKAELLLSSLRENELVLSKVSSCKKYVSNCQGHAVNTGVTIHIHKFELPASLVMKFVEEIGTAFQEEAVKLSEELSEL